VQMLVDGASLYSVSGQTIAIENPGNRRRQDAQDRRSAG
jgi:hypothetical protein